MHTGCSENQLVKYLNGSVKIPQPPNEDFGLVILGYVGTVVQGYL